MGFRHCPTFEQCYLISAALNLPLKNMECKVSNLGRLSEKCDSCPCALPSSVKCILYFDILEDTSRSIITKFSFENYLLVDSDYVRFG